MGYSPVVVYALAVVSYVVAYFVRLYLLRNIMQFPVLEYLKNIFVPLLLPAICLFVVQFLLINNIQLDSLIGDAVVKVLLCVFFSTTIMFGLYFSKEERKYALDLLRKRH